MNFSNTAPSGFGISAPNPASIGFGQGVAFGTQATPTTFGSNFNTGNNPTQIHPPTIGFGPPPTFPASNSTFTPSISQSSSWTASSPMPFSMSQGMTFPTGAPTGSSIPLTTCQQVEMIANAFSPQSPQCRLQYVMYNRVNPSEVGKFVKPPKANEKLWNQAVEANPDPTRLVPVLASGFNELKLRIEEQNNANESHQRALVSIESSVIELQRKHELDTKVKMENCKQRHLTLAHRVLRLMNRIEVLKNKGYPITMEEENFRNKLENLQRELNQPAHFKGQLNELASLIRLQEDHHPLATSEEVLEEESLAQISTLLEQQTLGLSHLIELLRIDMRDLNIIQENILTTHSDGIGGVG